ncbi:hypothetical protein PFICI_04680 [Pestalotiopsis fici W106-1]|uniref:Uncharacterized protein n=1 Tax=Pestalotiopsis fici (strain W106-1 / CGMCC3.15140) TaxID=1229662 RepID=W3X9V8_PESFW|nr:uncharacterized protein PFICI_04680 [Pestalotiopsis fici W106-1]ETS82804.1 hypothetical protein PFICI_04680 [Pestalotiopsis fici W106-1]
MNDKTSVMSRAPVSRSFGALETPGSSQEGLAHTLKKRSKNKQPTEPISPPQPPTYYLHFICGHHIVHNPDVTVTLRKKTTWEPETSGNVYNGKSAQIFCPDCASSLSRVTGAHHSYFFSCGHIESSDEALQMWWALQNVGLLAPGEQKLNMDCRSCESHDSSLVRNLLESWSRSYTDTTNGSGNGAASYSRGPVRIAELARALSYAQRSRRKSPDSWREYRWLWAQTCARSITHAELLRFLRVVEELWGPDFMLEVGSAVGLEYLSLLRRRIDADVHSATNHVPGADKVSSRVGLIKTLWASLDEMFVGLKGCLQSASREGRSLTSLISSRLGHEDLDTTIYHLFEAGRALQNATLKSWGSTSSAVSVEEAELIKISVRLDASMRNVDRWMIKAPDPNARLDELMHSISHGRKAALRLWIGNMALIHDMVMKAQARKEVSRVHSPTVAEPVFQPVNKPPSR